MATANFNLFLKVYDSKLGNKISFSGKIVEIWLQQDGYTEMLGKATTNSEASASFSFSLNYETTVPQPLISLKIFDGDKEFPYTFKENSSTNATLGSESVTLTPVIDLGGLYTGVTNDLISSMSVLSSTTGEPYTGLRIQTSIISGEATVQELSNATTNTMGFFSFSFTKNKDVISALDKANTKLEFKIYASDDSLLGTYDYAISNETNFSTLIIIKMDLTIPAGFVSTSIDGLSQKLGISISPQLSTYLSAHNINSLRDIRAIGGLGRQEELQQTQYKEDTPTIQRLDGHAQLETLSDRYDANDHIISLGYNSVHRISLASRNAFATAVVDHVKVSDFDALNYYSIASAHNKLYTGIFANYHMQAQNPNNPSTINNIIKLIDDKCSCKDCDSAVSPTAYLADLLWYATNHLNIALTPSNASIWGFQNGPVTLSGLSEMFCQDFCLSSEQCDSINDVICQYRIAIEVLQCYKTNVLTGQSICQELQFPIDERNYLLSAYYTLLEQMGTTFSQVRAVYNNIDLTVKASLAENLGIVATISPAVALPDGRYITNTTDALYIDTNLPINGLNNSQISTYLEKVFGLRNYTKDCTYTQPTPYVEIWMEAFLSNEWLTEDTNTDVYSLKQTIVIDPDILTRDDFRFPYHTNLTQDEVFPAAVSVHPTLPYNTSKLQINSYSAPINYPPVPAKVNITYFGNIPYAIWRNRKIFLSNFWNNVLVANTTPHGLEHGSRTISISGDFSNKLAPGKKFKIVNPQVIANSVTYTVDNSYYNAGSHVTIIKIVETIGSVSQSLMAASYLEFLDGVDIDVFSTPTPHTAPSNTIQVSGDLVLGPNTRIEIRESGTNDGFYTTAAELPVYNVAGYTTITIPNILFDPHQPVGKIYFTRIIPITVPFAIKAVATSPSVSPTTTTITLSGNVEIAANSTIQILGSTFTTGPSNDGSYTVNASGSYYDIVSGQTLVTLTSGTVLNSNTAISNGALSVITPAMPLIQSIAPIDSIIQPSTIVLAGSYSSISTGDLIQIKGSLGLDGITTNDRAYKVASASVISGSHPQTKISVLDATLESDGSTPSGLKSNGQLCLFANQSTISQTIYDSQKNIYSLVLPGNVLVDPGSTIQVSNSGVSGTTNDGIYITGPAAPVYTSSTNQTKIDIVGAALNVSVSPAGQLSILPSALSASYNYTAVANQMVVADNLPLSPGSQIVIWGSSNNGIYTVNNASYNGSSTTITLSSNITSNGQMFPINTLTSAFDPSYLRIWGDISGSLADNLNVYVSGSINSDGKYRIHQPSNAAITTSANTADIPGGYTQIALDDQIPVTGDVGNISFLSTSLDLASIKPSLGNRTILISDSYIGHLLAAGTSRVSIPSLNKTFTINTSSIASATSTSVTVNEALTGNEKGTVAHVLIDVTTDTGGGIVLIGDLTSIPSFAIKVGSSVYQATTSLQGGTGPNTQLTLDTPLTPSSPVTIEILYDGTISSIDTSNTKFTIPAPVLSGGLDTDTITALNATPRVVIVDSTTTTNPNNFIEFTVNSVSSPYVALGDTAQSIDIFVNEPIPDGNIIINGRLKYNELTLPLAYSRPKIQAIFNILKGPIGSFPVDYTKISGLGNTSIVNNIFPWLTYPGNNDITTFISLRDTLLDNTDTIAVANALAMVQNLNLTQDSFIAMVNICEQYLNDITPNADLSYAYSGGHTVTTSQYVELFNILCFSLKRAFFNTWLGEEQDSNNQVQLDNANFWASLTEPVEGSTDITLSNNRVVIDPQLVNLSNLPDMPSAESDAVSVWNRRNDQLLKLKISFNKVRQAFGIDALLQTGLARVSPFDALDFNWDTLNSNLQNVNSTISIVAQAFITGELSLSTSDFATLYQIRSMIKLSNSVPSQEQYNQVYQILIGTYKRNILYQDWAQEDSDYFMTQPNGNYTERVLFYDWLAYKSTLPKWRASANDRIQWHNALISKTRTPIIDPDAVFSEDFYNVASSAYSLWVSRTSGLATLYADVRDKLNTTTSGNVTQMFSILLFMNDPIGGFDLLGDMEDAGIDITPALGQLCLTYPIYKRLLALSAVNWSQLLGAEQTELINIFVQVRKLRDNYGTWNNEETAAHVTLSGSVFSVTPPAYSANPVGYYETLPAQRATWTARRAWQKTLQGRVDQWSNVPVINANIVRQTEDKVLKIIRDALVMYCGKEYDTLLDNANALEDRFLVDFSMACCQDTTRIASAIDLVQKLIFNTNLGVDSNITIATDPNTVTAKFTLETNNFQEDWQWLGSYATWRSAMFVFMYPQNLLDPTLRYYQTPAFENLVSAITGANRLTPADACELAQTYSKYFEDVCNIILQATAYVTVTQVKDVCVNKIPLPDQDTFFAFGTSSRSGAAYYHTKVADLQTVGSVWKDKASADVNYSAWIPITALSQNVVKIIGSSAYKQQEGVRHLFLFAVIYQDLAYKLVFVKYDLEGQTWDDTYTELSMPDDVDYGTIIVMQRNDDPLPPKLLYRGKSYQGIYTNRLNGLGKDWSTAGWLQVESHAKASLIETIHAYGEYTWYGSSSVHEEIIVAKFQGESSIKYKLTGDNVGVQWQYDKYGFDDGRWLEVFSNARFMGMTLFIWTPQSQHVGIGIIGNVNGQPQQVTINSPSNLTVHNTYATLTDIDSWIYQICGRSIKDIALTASEGETFSKAITTLTNTIGDYYSGYDNSFYGILQLFQDKIGYGQSPYDTFFPNSKPFWDICGLVSSVIDRFCTDITNTEDELHRDFLFLNNLCISRLISITRYSWDNNDDHSLRGLLNTISTFLNNPHYSSGYERHHHFVVTWSNRLPSIATAITRVNETITSPVNIILSYTGTGLMPHHGAINNICYRAYYQDQNTVGNFAGVFGTNLLSSQIYITSFDSSTAYKLNPTAPLNQYIISEEFSDDQLNHRATNICTEYIMNWNYYDVERSREYLYEAYYFVPMYIGLQLSQRGYFEESLKWMKTVYNYTNNTPIYAGLRLDTQGNSNDYSRTMSSWIDDPLNPHALASTRDNSYLQYTISNIAQTFISYGDSLFSLDTSETVSKAEEMYRFAIHLLGMKIFAQQPAACDIALNQVSENTICLLNQGGFTDASNYAGTIDAIFAAIPAVGVSNTQYQAYVNAVQAYLVAGVGNPGFNFAQNMANAWAYIESLTKPSPITLGYIMGNMSVNFETINAAVMSLPLAEHSSAAVAGRVTLANTKGVSLITGYSSEQLQDHSLPISWIRDPKQQYTFDYQSTRGKELIAQNGMSWTSPTKAAGQTLVYTMNPQDALNIVNSYPFPYVPNPVPSMGGNFCVPPDPVYSWMSMSAQLSLFKIRNCMNIAGMKQELSPYSAPTDSTTGLPSIGSNGQIVMPGINPISPTIYRYETIIARAKQITGMAQQVESAYLSAMANFDQESYNIMKAKQDLALSKATVTLKQLQAKVASDQVDLANLQKQKSEAQIEQLDGMINSGLNQYEKQMVIAYQLIATMQVVSDTLSTTASSISNMAMTTGQIVAGVADSVAIPVAFALDLTAAIVNSQASIIRASEYTTQAAVNIDSVMASQARRVQEWDFQKAMAQQDVKIGTEQITIAQDGVRVASQDTAIANLQQQNNQDTVNFLNTKFTNVDLYNWMSKILGQVYGYFLQEATNIAKMAQNQLAFERQEIAQRFIQDDYWETPVDNNTIQRPGTSSPDRRGLTGSARLQEDITKLDDYAFMTDKFKLQITKTFSMLMLAPMDFETFKSTGVLNFATLMDYFDQDYPGHYLRLIKAVRVTVIALIPPTQGIKATLTSSGISRVTIGGSTFQDVTIRRNPEMIALSGTSNASGVFNLQGQDPNLLNPFEDSGVCMNWEFKMPKASNLFDYSSIADVQLSMDYTALYDSGYESQVINNLGNDFTADRAYSFVNEEPDAFYQWSNPDQFSGSSTVKVSVSPSDFPANVSGITISQVKVVVITDAAVGVFSDPTGTGVSINITPFPTRLVPVPQPAMTGNAGFNTKGIISTQTNGGSLSGFIGKSPIGNWNITLNGLTDSFTSGNIEDVLLVITYSGTLPDRN